MFYELKMYTLYLASRAPGDSVDQAVYDFANGLNKKEFRYLLSLSNTGYGRKSEFYLKQGRKIGDFVLNKVKV